MIVTKELLLLKQVDDLRRQLAEAEAKLAGSQERALLILDAKDHWADRANAAEAKLALAEQERDALRSFANDMMECWPEGDVDGGYLQEAAEKHGLLVATPVTVPCGENCGCAEFYSAGEIADCYHRTPLLIDAALAAGEQG